jgi:glycosyltransferase involved in cell wall biosynthesis
MKLSIVIPAYNEEFRISQTLESYCTFFTIELGDDFEVIVVANHCSDNTVQVVRRIMMKFPVIRLIVEPSHIGKGGAVKMGMKIASGDYVGFSDADGSTPASMFIQLMEHIGEAGCIIGSRWISGAVVTPRQPWLRRVASRVLNKLVVQGIFGLNISDSQCGAKLFARDVLDIVLAESSEPGWAFDIDLLCRVKRLGYATCEFPIEWNHVPGNPINFMLMSLQMLASVWRVKRGLKH